jgi:hypothetical protein
VIGRIDDCAVGCADGHDGPGRLEQLIANGVDITKVDALIRNT